MSEKINTIQKVDMPKDFFRVYNSTGRDKKLSLEAKGLLMILLSLPPDWVIRKDQIKDYSNSTVYKTRKAFNELEKYKYIYGAQRYKNNLKNGITYFVFSSPYNEESEEFKKCLRHDVFRHAELRSTDIQRLQRKKEETKEYTNKKSKPKKDPANTESKDSLASKDTHVSLEFSNDVKEVYKMLVDSILSLRPTFKIKAEKKSLEEIDLMVRIDSRDIHEIKQVLEWLPSNEFWRKNILSGKSLRDKYDKLCIEYEGSKDKAKINKYKVFAGRVKSTINRKSMQISDKGIFDSSDNFELSYKMQYDEFCRCLAKKYRILDYERAM